MAYNKLLETNAKAKADYNKAHKQAATKRLAAFAAWNKAYGKGRKARAK